MIPKSGNRFSETIMRKQYAGKTAGIYHLATARRIHHLFGNCRYTAACP
jgi:hypothetical protein